MPLEKASRQKTELHNIVLKFCCSSFDNSNKLIQIKAGCFGCRHAALQPAAVVSHQPTPPLSNSQMPMGWDSCYVMSWPGTGTDRPAAWIYLRNRERTTNILQLFTRERSSKGLLFTLLFFFFLFLFLFLLFLLLG
jgi:hypothetical protein